MCGIAGTVGCGDDLDLTQGLQALFNRGPDEIGGKSFEGGQMGIRRLAIVDLTPGVQPVENEDGQVVAVVNGEIYNHVELAEEIRGTGHKLKSRTDAEVVPHLYEEHGEQFVAKLRGMFAVAMWDAGRRRLILARDRFGKKPLYYAQTGDGLVFASEIKALRAMMPNDLWRVQDQAIYDFLSLGFIPQPDIVFSGIEQVPPGALVIFDGGKKEIRQYWDTRLVDQKSNATEVRERVAESVGLRLLSDVPVGVFLSGGIDSNVVAYEAAQATDGDIQTYTVQMPDADLDESVVAQAAARAYGVRNELLPLEISPEKDLPAVIRHYDQPFADSSALACWAIARTAAEKLKVVLTGDGGDELFGGYRRHLAAYRLGQMQAVPKCGWRGLSALLPRRRRRSRWGFARRFARGAGAEDGRRYLAWSSDLLMEDDKRTIWNGADVEPTESWIEALIDEDASLLRQQMQLDCQINLLSDLLVKMDMATMAHSLEARSPFLDHELAGYAMGIVDEDLLRGGITKSVLRNAYADVLPAAVLNGAKKGFEVPVEKWLEEEWRELSQDLLGSTEPESAAYIDRKFIRHILEDRLEGDWNVPMLKYTLLVLELWLREQKN